MNSPECLARGYPRAFCPAGEQSRRGRCSPRGVLSLLASEVSKGLPRGKGWHAATAEIFRWWRSCVTVIPLEAISDVVKSRIFSRGPQNSRPDSVTALRLCQDDDSTRNPSYPAGVQGCGVCWTGHLFGIKNGSHQCTGTAGQFEA